MKKILLFLITSLTVVSLAYATPAPVRKSTSVSKKPVVTHSIAKGSKSVKSSKKAAAVTRKYKVQKGDSLYTIARRQGMKLADLQRLNGLKSSRLKPGQVLLVSGSTKNSGKAQSDGVVEESGKAISQIALPNAEGEYNDSLADAGIEPIARTYLSIPYRYGAQSRKSTDCSGFVQQVFREFDITLPRTAREQYQVGLKVDRSSLASGDLLFFRTRARKKYPTHVGIYLGNGKMIHASSRQHKVVISDVNHPFYVKRYVGAKRTATFLSGEIDLEMLARQVTGMETDAPLSSVIAADVQEEGAVTSSTGEVLQADASAVQAVAPVADVSDQSDAASGDEEDDIDNDVEPESESIVSEQPNLGLVPPLESSTLVASRSSNDPPPANNITTDFVTSISSGTQQP